MSKTHSPSRRFTLLPAKLPTRFPEDPVFISSRFFCIFAWAQNAPWAQEAGDSNLLAPINPLKQKRAGFGPRFCLKMIL
jgi:hypothetical protein